MTTRQFNPFQEAAYFFQPAAGINDAETLRLFLAVFGFQPDTSTLQSAYSSLEQPLDSLRDLTEQLAVSNSDIEEDALKMIVPLVKTLLDFASADDLQALTGGNDIVDELLNHLVFSYVSMRFPTVEATLQALQIIDVQMIDPDDVTGRAIAYREITFRWHVIADILKDPAAWANTHFNWHDATELPDYDAIMEALQFLFEALDFALPYSRELSAADLTQFLENVPPDATFSSLWLPLWQDNFNDVTEEGELVFDGEIGLRIVPRGNINTPANMGLAVAPYARGSRSHSIPIDNLTLSLNIGANLTGKQYFVVSPQGVRLEAVDNSALPSTDGEFSFALEGQNDGSRLVLIGHPEAPVLHAGALKIELGGTLRPAVKFEARLDDVLVSITNEGDSFITAILPSEFEITIGNIGLAASTDGGIYLIGGNALSVKLPLHIDLGVVVVQQVAVGIELDTPAISFGFDIAGKLGPVDVAAQGIGLRVLLSDIIGDMKQAGQAGTEKLIAGFVSGFKPPNGLGLSIDTGPVSGEGFLAFFPDEHRYAGTFALQINSYAITVVGLLATRLPGGDKGFSLLLIITANLPPIQLGFGFVLSGIGGLAGIHRGFETVVLGDAVRAGSIDSVLFPDNVVENATSIISDLRGFFPPRSDYHVFGPMLELGWGTPVLIRMQVGVLVSIPAWQIALLGKIEIELPAPEAPLIELNLAILGVLDIPNKSLSIDASLYDSRLVIYKVSGDMAMRLTWGEDARFMLSIGGFHPRYTPPASFPSLDRMRATLGKSGGNPRLELTGYLAITPNTFQIGAALSLYVKAGPARVKGGLSFDALFRFNPFEFIIDFSAHLRVEIFGKGLGLRVSGTLSGPGPFRVRGKLTVDLWLFEATIRFKVKFGAEDDAAAELPTVDVLPRLAAEFARPQNWMTLNPPSEGQIVVLQSIDGDDNSVLAHPLAEFAVRQQIVPLGITIEKYGNARPRHTRFEVANFLIDDAPLTGDTTLRERFAPAHYQDMTDDEKLSAPAFEKLPAGRTLSGTDLNYATTEDGDAMLSKVQTLAYESIIIDSEKQVYRGVDDEASEPSDVMIDHFLLNSAVAHAPVLHRGAARYQNPGQTTVLTLDDERYVIVHVGTLQRANIAGNPSDGQTHVEANEALRNHLHQSPQDRGTMRVVTISEVGD